MNKVMLIGNLTRDPEVSYTQAGQAVAKLGVAQTRKFKSGDENKEETTFVDVTVWGQSAEFCGKYLEKGNRVSVEGRLKYDSWDDRETGKKRNKLTVTAEKVDNLTPRQDSGQQQNDGSVPF
jgi:single-strand DNA-binding protein